MSLFRAAPRTMRLRFISRDPITGAVGIREGAELAVEVRDGDGELFGVFSRFDVEAVLRELGYRPVLLVPGLWIADGQAPQPLWPEKEAA